MEEESVLGKRERVGGVEVEGSESSEVEESTNGEPEVKKVSIDNVGSTAYMGPTPGM